VCPLCSQPFILTTLKCLHATCDRVGQLLSSSLSELTRGGLRFEPARAYHISNRFRDCLSTLIKFCVVTRLFAL
jgi:hypothetical protein